MPEHRIFGTPFSGVYPLTVQKAERKNRTKGEVDQIICWLTGYSQAELQQQIECQTARCRSSQAGHGSPLPNAGWAARGMAKQGGDREPIGDCADHGRFGGGAYQTQPGIAPLKECCNGEHERDGSQQGGSKRFRAVEFGLAIKLVRHGDRDLRDHVG